MADEIDQRVPFASRGQEVMVGLMRTSEVLRNRLTDGLARVDDITLQQYNVLRILRGAGEEGLPTLAVAERMIERQPGVTRLIDRLLRKGLVERRRSQDDCRVVRCTISDAGRETLERLDAVIAEVDGQIARAFDGARLESLIAALDALRAELSEE